MRKRLEPRRRATLWVALGLAWLSASAALAAESAPQTAVMPGSAEPAPSPAAAEMLESMHDKGLLTDAEYEELYRRQARYEAEHAADALPGWLRDWTFGGDLRFRFERSEYGALDFDQVYRVGSDNVDVINGTGRGNETRSRIRLRLGAEKKVVESLTFGFRIATGSDESYGEFFNTGGTSFQTSLAADPRSNNVTLGDFFSPKSIYLDRAYVRWQPTFARTLSVSIGKIANPFVSEDYAADFLVWDNDIQPEGAALRYRFDFVPEKLWLDTRGAFFTIQEQNTISLSGFDASTGEIDPVLPDIDDQNPFLLGFQGGIHGAPAEWVRTGARVSYYDVQHIGTRMAAALQDLGNGGDAIENNPLFRLLGPTNRLYEDGSSQGRMRELVVDGYARFTPWGERWAITPFFQWMTLLDADSENTGWSAGVELGSIDLLKITAMYASIERNATVSLFTDSDVFEGFTNVKGWYVSAERRLWRGVRMRSAFIYSRQNQDDCDLAERSTALCDTASQISVLGPYRETTLDRTRWQVDLMVDF